MIDPIQVEKDAKQEVADARSFAVNHSAFIVVMVVVLLVVFAALLAL